MSNFIVGLTGGIGSGKTAASDAFAKHGITIVDADIIARQVVEPGQPALHEIAHYFGHDILLDNGHLNRIALRQRTFSNEKSRQWLNQLLHPLIRQQMQLQTAAADSAYVILAVPLLIENKLQSLVNRVLVIDVPETMQISRASVRDANSQEQIKRIMQSQISRQSRLAAADDVLNNSGDLAQLQAQVDRLHLRYLQLAASGNH